MSYEMHDASSTFHWNQEQDQLPVRHFWQFRWKDELVYFWWLIWRILCYINTSSIWKATNSWIGEVPNSHVTSFYLLGTIIIMNTITTSMYFILIFIYLPQSLFSTFLFIMLRKAREHTLMLVRVLHMSLTGSVL